MISTRLTLCGLAAVCLGACASCSTQAATASDAGVDVAVDSKKDGAAAACFWDGSVISDWPGFRRLTELSPCCTADVALDAAALPVLNWIPCENGAPNCREVQRTWSVTDPGSFFGLGPVSHDVNGVPALLPLGFPLSGTSGMTGFYSLPSLQLVAGFRADNGNTSGTPAAQCPFNELAAGNNIALLVRAGSSGAMVAGLMPDTFGSAAGASTLAPPGAIPGFQTAAASPTRLAFDVQPYGWIWQWAFDAGAAVQSNNTTGAALLFDFIEGDDVFAMSVYGTAGWQQEYRVSRDGSVMLFRGKDSTAVGPMVTDGTTLVWCEAYGASTSSQQQPTVEVWSAPYTNDPVALGITAKKLVTLPGAVWCGQAVAFQGYFATQIASTYDKAIIVRLSDGATQQLSAGTGWTFDTFALVSATELWSVTDRLLNDAGASWSGYEFARYTLGAWP